MKKIITYFLAVLAIVPLMSSCSSNSGPTADVTVWHWMTDRQTAFEKIAEQYFKETGIKVVFETYAPSEVYRDKVRAAASGKLLPEIYSPLGDKRELAAFIKSGYVANLTKDMETGWKDIFFAKPLSQSTYQPGNDWNVEPGVYGVPFDVNSILIFYNKNLFKQAGLDADNPPKTWEEFILAGKKLRAAGIQPFVCGFGEPWLIGAFTACFQWNMLGEQGVISTIRGDVKYTDPRWVKVFGVIEEMKKANIFASGVATMVNKDAERTFATERAAMAYNGSWGLNVYKGMNPKIDYGIMMMPVLSEGKFPIAIFGGEGSSFNVNEQSPNKQKAIEFLKWLTAKEQQVALSKETLNIPSNKMALEGLPDTLMIFAKSIDNAFPSLPVVEAWQVTNVFNTGLQSIVIGEKSAETVAKEVQEEKDNQMMKKANK